MDTNALIKDFKAALEVLALPEKAAFYPKFFKAGKGEYAEGDLFLGVTVPEQRKVAKHFGKLFSLNEISELIKSPYHEHRLCSLLMLVEKFEKAKTRDIREEVVASYLHHIEWINNWDLVDTSCYKILGAYCYDTGNDKILLDLAKKDHLWSKRIAVVSTMFYVKKGDFRLLKEIVLLNLEHTHDLMHKANGWLLREMGNKSETELLNFLNQHYQQMPRTTLRYAIEKLEEETRQDYLKGRM